MVGAAILTARGVLPPNTITAALQLPYRFIFPMVPAEGLFLKYAGFGENAGKVRTNHLRCKFYCVATESAPVVCIFCEKYCVNM